MAKSTEIFCRVLINSHKTNDWFNNNNILYKGELGYDEDLNLLKVGNGKDSFSELNYLTIDSIDWSKVNNKPNSFNPSSHTHTFDSITDKPSSYNPSKHTHGTNDILNLIPELIDLFYPIGKVILISKENLNFNPNEVYPNTQWVSIDGKFLVGQDANISEFDTLGKTGGLRVFSMKHIHNIEAHTHIIPPHSHLTKDYTLTLDQIPSHIHNVSISKGTEMATSSNGSYYNTGVTYIDDGSEGIVETDINSTQLTKLESDVNIKTSDNHTHTIPVHSHTITESSVGGGLPHNHGTTETVNLTSRENTNSLNTSENSVNIPTIPPYEVIKIWKRIK